MKNKKLFAILTLVCFMFTLMPVAAFAGDSVADMSYFVAADGNQTVTEEKAKNTGVKFDLIMQDANEGTGNAANVYVWAVDENGTVSSALAQPEWNGNKATAANIDGVWVFAGYGSAEDVVLKFLRAGEYTVYAGLAKKGVSDVDSLAKINVFGDASVITVNGSSVNPASYDATLAANAYAVSNGETDANAETALGTITLAPNNVAEEFEVTFETAASTALRNKTVVISTDSSSIAVNKETATTNSRGEIKFEVSASVEGTYEIELEIEGVSWTIAVQVGNTAAAYIETAAQPTAPLAQYEALDDEIRFTITDINGNIVACDNPSHVKNHSENCKANGMKNTLANGNAKYVVLTEKPAASNLVSENLDLKYNADKQQWQLIGVNTMDAEGTYTVKVILDNGAYATASWTVKKFQTPVQLVIGTATDVVELGGRVQGELLYFDVNGVQKNADDAQFVADGYAVLAGQSKGYVDFTVKADEKYVGATINTTAVSEKYDLVATKTFAVADGPAAIAFVDKAADVNVNNKLVWNVVDSQGNKVALDGSVTKVTDIKYVVLDKPEGAKVSTHDATVKSDLNNKGIGVLNLTSNKVGNVTVQVVVKAVYSDDKETSLDQVKYYTGTQIIAVGTQGVGDVVVMSVGSNEIVINDAKATIDAAPVVENNRTFVPFRALAEAFGATVAYDEATQAVTAELNGVTVVMTIGSAEYTVNGVAKTADVAPFINGSRTMVPVRFAAEAFGIKVIPTYDENGATADILFNL